MKVLPLELQFWSHFGIPAAEIPREPRDARLKARALVQERYATGNPIVLKPSILGVMEKIVQVGNIPPHARHGVICVVRCFCIGLREGNDGRFPVAERDRDRFTRLVEEMTIQVGLRNRPVTVA